MIDRRTFLKLSGASLTASSLGGCGGVDKIPTPGVPRSPFDEDSTAEEVTEGMDLSGKLAVVTGCTSGIGFETMRVLALRGAYVVGTSRSLQKAQQACDQVIGTTSPLQLELSDLDSVVDCANAIRSINAPPDILVCNAGYLGGDARRELVNGVEKHFAINHLGHFVLVNRLLGRLYMANQGRIVVVASRSAYQSAPAEGIEFNNLAASYGYEDRRAYGQSKLANVLFSLHLSKLLRGTRMTVNALHPGLINTEIDRHMSGLKQFGFGLLAAVGGTKSVEQGAATSCHVATNLQLGATSGRYFEDCNAATVSEGHLHNEGMAEQLWQVSDELTSDYLVSHSGPDLNDFERALQKRKAAEE